MNKSIQKNRSGSQQKVKNPNFIEISMNPWFLSNLNHVGFYITEQPAGQFEADLKKIK
jgi:hypothetical protein